MEQAEIEITLSVFGRACGQSIRQRHETLPMGSTVRDLMKRLEEQDELPIAFGESDDFNAFYVVVNGRNAMVSGGLDRELEHQSSVLVLPAIASG